MIFIYVFFVFLSFSSCSGVSYLTENGIAQWKLFNRAKPVNEVIDSDQTPALTRNSILKIMEAKNFANALGLKATRSYEAYVALSEPCVVWALAAADPLELKEKTWKFPLVGEVPYLGFFVKKSALKEEQRLKEALSKEITPDTWVRCVPAFSSLGWFPDLLYSSMLKGNERDLVELVIHESLHATVWVGGSVDFNEKLANFVGLEGSLLFLKDRAGEAAWKEGIKQVRGEKLFGEFLQKSAEFYRLEVKNLEQKKSFYQNIAKRYEEFLHSKKKQGIDFLPRRVSFENWNNAVFLSLLNYYSDFGVFDSLLESCGGDLRKLIQWIVEEKKRGRLDDAPEENLDKLLRSSGCSS